MIRFIVWDSTVPPKYHQSGPKQSGWVHRLFAAMSCEGKLNTLHGGVITLDISMTTVELLRDSSIICWEFFDATGFFGAESRVTVAYTRNEVEAATKDDIHTQRCFGANILCSLTENFGYAFPNWDQLVLVTNTGQSVTLIWTPLWQGAHLL